MARLLNRVEALEERLLPGGLAWVTRWHWLEAEDDESVDDARLAYEQHEGPIGETEGVICWMDP